MKQNPFKKAGILILSNELSLNQFVDSELIVISKISKVLLVETFDLSTF